MRPKKRILLIGGDENRAGTTRFMLVTQGFAVTAANDTADALAYLAIEAWDLVLCDLPLPGLKDICDAVHATCPHVPVLIVGEREPVSSETFASIQERALGAAELVDRIKVLCARKRGPRKGTRKPVASAAARIVEGELVGVA
jgi:DNA-binding response OmpR family regulator